MTNDEDEILYHNDQYVHFATFKFQKSACSSKAHSGISRNSLVSYDAMSTYRPSCPHGTTSNKAFTLVWNRGVKGQSLLIPVSSR